MGFLDRLKDLANQTSTEGQAMWSRLQSAGFADATMAACALIGAADGKIDQTERSRTAQFITSHPQLKNFDVAALRQKYEANCDTVTRDFDFGKIELMQKIAKLASKPVEARAVVQLAVVIANADGDFDDKERQIVREIAHALKLDPHEFGV